MLAVTSSSVFTPRQQGNKYWIAFLVGSVVLHVVLAMMLQNQVKIGAEPFKKPFEKPKPTIKALDSYLVFTPKPEPERVEPEIEEPVSPPEKIEPQKVEAPEIKKQVVDPKPTELATVPSDAKPPTQQEQSDSELVYKGLEAATSNYFDRLNSNALSDVAQQEASDYYTNKNTVVLPKSSRFSYGKRYGPGNPKPVQVDCSSTVNKGLIALSTLTGGNINCFSAGNIQPFIDARLNKTYQHKETK